MGIVSFPADFPGTPEEREANRRSHNFDWSEGADARCFGCDCRPGSTSNNWPCGSTVPRVEVAR